MTSIIIDLVHQSYKSWKARTEPELDMTTKLILSKYRYFPRKQNCTQQLSRPRAQVFSAGAGASRGWYSTTVSSPPWREGEEANINRRIIDRLGWRWISTMLHSEQKLHVIKWTLFTEMFNCLLSLYFCLQITLNTLLALSILSPFLEDGYDFW